MTSEEFNEKYKDYLVEGYYGCAINDPGAIEYLDREFCEFTKIPGFKYHQIKSKWNYFCFYAENVPKGKTEEIELELSKIYSK